MTTWNPTLEEALVDWPVMPDFLDYRKTPRGPWTPPRPAPQPETEQSPMAKINYAVSDRAAPVYVYTDNPVTPAKTFVGMDDFETWYNPKLGHAVLHSSSTAYRTEIFMAALPADKPVKQPKAAPKTAAPVDSGTAQRMADVLAGNRTMADALAPPVKAPKTAKGPAAPRAAKTPGARAGDQWTQDILNLTRDALTRDEVIAGLCDIYPDTDRKAFDNVMYGTLERLVGGGFLTKAKVGKNMKYCSRKSE